MKLYEVRAKNKKYCASNEIATIMCTTLSKAKEIANECAFNNALFGNYKCVWIITYDVRDEMVCMGDYPMIEIRDDFSK